MNSKLTLTIERTVVERAKKYAKKKGRSLSNIIENYLKTITVEEEKAEKDITPLVKSLQGSFKAPKDFDYKKALSDILAEKYLKK